MQYDWLGDLKHLLACPEQIETFAAQFAARCPPPSTGEAVAWMVKNGDEIVGVRTTRAQADALGSVWEEDGPAWNPVVIPLYAHQPAVEARAAVVETPFKTHYVVRWLYPTGDVGRVWQYPTLEAAQHAAANPPEGFKPTWIEKVEERVTTYDLPPAAPTGAKEVTP